MLVAVLNNEADLARARDEHWYRIPVNHAPRHIAAEYLAFYQTGRFGKAGRCVRYYAPILRYHLVTRRELIPDEPDHPRADAQYFKLEIAPLETLEPPIANTRHPRLTFLYTTLELLFHANDVGDLWLRKAARQRLYAAIQERGLAVECWYPLEMGDRPEADLALFGPHGRLTITIDEPLWEELDEHPPQYDTSHHHINALDILRDAAGVLHRIID